MLIANGIMDTVTKHLPSDVTVAGMVECFDKAAYIVRLEGDGLPEWCKEPPNGESYAWAAMFFAADGSSSFAKVDLQAKSLYQRVQEQYGSQN
jgi:hypothetical protein